MRTSAKRALNLTLAAAVVILPGCQGGSGRHDLDDVLPVGYAVGTFVAFTVGIPACVVFSPITLPLSSRRNPEAIFVPGLILGVPCGVLVGLPFAVIDLVTLPFRHWLGARQMPEHRYPNTPPQEYLPPPEDDANWPVVEDAPRGAVEPAAEPPQLELRAGATPADPAEGLVEEPAEPDPLDSIVPCPCCGKPTRTDELRCPDCPPTPPRPVDQPVESILDSYDTPAPAKPAKLW